MAILKLSPHISTLKRTTRDFHSVIFSMSNSAEVDEPVFDRDSNSDVQKLFKIKFDEVKGNYTEFWNSVQDLNGNDALYPRDYDATQVTGILRKGKLIHTDYFDKPGSLKLKIRFEGGQLAIFKIMAIERRNKTISVCNSGCEHPVYETAAFTLNRMFDLRNMPYTTGRIISWADEMEPVATTELKKLLYVQKDRSVCIDWKCRWKHPESLKTYCFKDGMIPGAVIYYIEHRKIDLVWGPKSIYAWYHPIGVKDIRDLDRLPSDKTYCNKVRNHSLYKKDDWFLDLADNAVIDYMMSHVDSKHNYVTKRGTNKPEYNVMFDYGHAYCDTYSFRLLAPLIQCCRMRTRLFKALERYRDTLEEEFISLTKDDPLHPLLLPETMADMKWRLKHILIFIDLCRSLEGDSNVFIDL